MKNDRYSGKIKLEFFGKVQEYFKIYRDNKQELDHRIIDNNRWYKSRYNSDPDAVIPEPTTPYLFNVIANKHADAMDNYPEPNILERSEEDTQVAEKLTKILPMQLDLCDFKRTYSRAWWYKLKNGASCYGIFYNPDSGKNGDIDIKRIDLLNMFWEPGIIDIQDSKFVFLTALIDREELKVKYPHMADRFTGGNSMDILTYDDVLGGPDQNILRDKCLVVDCYYKKTDGEKQTVELLKFYDGNILEASEDIGEDGIYDHGMYPFVFDVLYPDEDSPVGFGFVDIVKNPQLYIDKLDGLISRNALISGKTRFMVKDNGGLNEYELSDLSRDIIHVAGSVSDENIRELQAKPMHSFIIQHRQNKIEELKEIAGNRDFQQGDTHGGVTAYSAIVALQQAGEKLARDMLVTGYDAFRDIIYFCIELMRQFYDDPRSYRINRSNGKGEYVTFSKDDLENGYHRAEFDISVSAEKNNPYSRIAQNQTLTELWLMGIFDPKQADASILMREAMHLDGKEKIIEGLKNLKAEYEENINTELEVNGEKIKSPQHKPAAVGVKTANIQNATQVS